MPQLISKPPRYCHHKATDRAVVYLGGKAHYLGRYGSPESKSAYKKIVAEWSTGPTPVDDSADPAVAPVALTIVVALAQYRAHCDRYYQSREVANLGEALRPLREQFGKMPLSGFGPMQLRLLRDQWIEKGLARRTINNRMKRVRRFFRWAASFELVDTKVLDRLATIEPLMPGRGGRETKPKLPVTWGAVEATLPHLPEMVRAMVLFAWHTGARPSEVTGLTAGMIDQSADVWIAKLDRHKNSHRGMTREIPINKAAQVCLAPWLRFDKPDEPVFSPLRVDARQPNRKGKRTSGRAYARNSFGQTIRRGCHRAGIPVWSPNALRHAFGTRMRDIGGIEASQIALGHAKPDTTLIYAGAAKQRMLDAVRQAG